VIVCCVLCSPHEAKYRSLKKSNAAFQRKLGGVTGGAGCLAAVGFTDGGGETWDLVPSEQAWNVVVT
jgi:hypothetical protein